MYTKTVAFFHEYVCFAKKQKKKHKQNDRYLYTTVFGIRFIHHDSIYIQRKTTTGKDRAARAREKFKGLFTPRAIHVLFDVPLVYRRYDKFKKP